MKSLIKNFVWLGLGISLLLGVLLSPFASKSPDGLERVAMDKGFIAKSEEPGISPIHHAPLKDYSIPGLKNEKAATGAAGLVGVLGTFFIVYGFSRILRKRQVDKQ